MAQDRQRLYREYLTQSMGESSLLKLELTYLDLCGQFMLEHGLVFDGPGEETEGPEAEESKTGTETGSETESASDPSGLLFEMGTYDLLLTADRLRDDEAFQAFNRQKNGRLLRALDRYISFRIGAPVPVGPTPGKAGETTPVSGRASVGERETGAEIPEFEEPAHTDTPAGFPVTDLTDPAPLEDADYKPASSGRTRNPSDIERPQRLSRSLEELLTEPDPGNPEGIPAWREREISPAIRAQILRRERERRAREEKAAAERAALRAAFAEKNKREDLQKQVDSLQRQLQAGRYGRRSPEYMRLQEQIDSLQRQLLDLQGADKAAGLQGAGQLYSGPGQGVQVPVIPVASVPQGVQIPAASVTAGLQGVQIPVTLAVQGMQIPGAPDAVSGQTSAAAGPEGSGTKASAADSGSGSSAASAVDNGELSDEDRLSAGADLEEQPENTDNPEEAAAEKPAEAETGTGDDPDTKPEEEQDAEEEGDDSDPAEGPGARKASPLDDPDFVPRSMKILFGRTLDTEEPEEYYWEPNNTSRVFHMNTGIIGTMGTGKTQFTKSLVTQLMTQAEDNFDGTLPGILIFDYKGDYNESKMDFVEAVSARVIKPYHLPFNPFSIVETSTFRPLLPTHTANAFKDILARVYRLGPKQQSSLFRCIMSAYEGNKIRPDKPDTWKNTAPTFADVFEKYEKDETIPKNDSLAAAMNKLKMFELFEPVPEETGSLFDLLRGTVVIDLSGYDPDIQSLVVAITLQLFYTQMVASGSSMLKNNLRQLTRMVLVDEADNFMSEDFPALKKILKEGREFGVGVVLSTQSLKHFETDDNSYADYIMTWVVHNVADLKDKDVDFVFRVPQKSLKETELLRRVKELEKFESIVKVGNEEPVRLRDLAFWELLEKNK